MDKSLEDLREEAGINLTDESLALLDFFEMRGISEQEACAVMGVTLATIINDEQTARVFLRTLRSSISDSLQMKKVH